MAWSQAARAAAALARKLHKTTLTVKKSENRLTKRLDSNTPNKMKIRAARFNLQKASNKLHSVKKALY